MGPKISVRRHQYSLVGPEVLLPSGVSVKIKYIEIYPESIGIYLPSKNKNELVVLVGEALEKCLSGKTIGETMDENGYFIEQVVLNIDSDTINAFAKFELAQEGYIYLIRLIYLS